MYIRRMFLEEILDVGKVGYARTTMNDWTARE